MRKISNTRLCNDKILQKRALIFCTGEKLSYLCISKVGRPTFLINLTNLIKVVTVVKQSPLFFWLIVAAEADAATIFY
jgi:hypothetical protein